MTPLSPLPAPIPQLAQAVVRRQTSLLHSDMAERAEQIAAAVRGRRFLVVGGAGSIGGSTVAQLAAYAPHQLHVVDTDENALTELVRDLRSRGAVAATTELRTTPLDAGSSTMRRLLAADDYDHVLNFAAVKHVRSEKDVFSLLRMIEVNLRTARRLAEWVSDTCERYFTVSTDKAANPVNLMGASKRAMEHLVLDPRVAPAVTTARFANVAFSRGSLLEGWLTRLAKRQPWAVPVGTRRYFVTLEESGQLCLLAALLGPDRHVVIPDLDPTSQLRDLVEVAEDVLAALGLRPRFCHEEEEARRLVPDGATDLWPVLLTPLDTAGEKEFEEFAGAGDVVHDVGFGALRALKPAIAPPAEVDAVLAEVDRVLDHPDEPADEASVTALISRLVPELRHRSSAATLDARM